MKPICGRKTEAGGEAAAKTKEKTKAGGDDYATFYSGNFIKPPYFP